MCARRARKSHARLGGGFLFSRPVAAVAAAVGAGTEHAQRVVRGLEAVLGGDGVLHGFELFGIEFDGLPAIGADHVVVVRVIVVVLVARAPVAEAHFARQPRVGQKFERAIDGGLPDLRVFLLHEPVEVFARQVFLGAQEHVEDEVALRRAFETRALDVAMKNFLFFSHNPFPWFG